jgi:hypothetical protein
MNTGRTAEKRTTSKKHSRRRKILLLLGVVVLIGIGAYFVYTNIRDSTPLDSYAKKLDFPIYYPSQLPKDYTVSSKDVSMTGSLIVYKLTSTTKKPEFVFTEQAAPPNFDANKMIGKNATALAVPTGTLYDVEAGQQGKYILTTGSTLIFINANSKPDSGMINSLALSLRKVE